MVGRIVRRWRNALRLPLVSIASFAAFSAASNVTGIVTDVAALTAVVKQAGALMIWDYAGAGPYVPINMVPEQTAGIDAIVVSPHKFIGGPAHRACSLCG